jgi:hypothetical protein
MSTSPEKWILTKYLKEKKKSRCQDSEVRSRGNMGICYTGMKLTISAYTTAPLTHTFQKKYDAKLKVITATDPL